MHVLIEERPSHLRVGLLCSCVAAGRAYAERLGSDFAQIRTFSWQERFRKDLDKQLTHVALKRSDSIMIVALVVAFFGGVALGGALFAPESKLVQTA